MNIQELQNYLLSLSANERWQVVGMLLESLQTEMQPKIQQRGNLSRLRGIAKVTSTVNSTDDYVSYLTTKYR